VDTARTAVESITAASTIGRHLAAKSEGDRLVTHLFEARLSGYQGRSKVVTVNELGLLPSEDSILAPEWVPWAERVLPGDEQEPEQVQEEELASGGQQADAEAAADGEARDADTRDADTHDAAAAEPAQGSDTGAEDLGRLSDDAAR
jgi:hypothetical protein